MAVIELKIEGMSCQHCVMAVKKAVSGIKGVTSADVSVGAAKIVYDEIKTNKDEIAKAIVNAGYKVK
ncbi:MAG: heavy-metal-associated domain-containing protein [Nitrospirae bacterium]|nr:heavy-metal-associated domain-containing protein [Nitrospirota bacterium]